MNTFGLTVEKTDSSVGGLFGRAWERYGTSKVKSIAMGNCMVTNVPVAIADLSGMNPERSAAATGTHISDSKAIARFNGVLGAREMVKFGMIIDCTRQMLYINPNGASSRREPESREFPGQSRFYEGPDATQRECSLRC